MTTELNPFSILVADDDVDDRFFIQRAIAESGMTNDVHYVEDGQLLVERLRDHLAATGAERLQMPCLILLDLNMPRLNGREALRFLKNHEKFKEIPVVVLTNSRDPEDLEGSYRDGANSFFTKPREHRLLVELMRLLKTYWHQALPLAEGS